MIGLEQIWIHAAHGGPAVQISSHRPLLLALLHGQEHVPVALLCPPSPVAQLEGGGGVQGDRLDAAEEPARV